MELQVIFNIVVAIAGAFGGWILKVIWDSIRAVDKDVKELTRDVNNDFVRRDDFKESIAGIKTDMRDGFKEVKDMLGAVFNRLESKQDKGERT